MARFRSTINGQRGEASRLGSAASGMVAEVNGWNAGVTVIASDVNGVDCFDVYQTGGSNGNGNGRRVRLASIIDGKVE